MKKSRKFVQKFVASTILVVSAISLSLYLSSCSSVDKQETNKVFLSNQLVNEINSVLKGSLSKLDTVDKVNEITQILKADINSLVKNMDGLEVLEVSLSFINGTSNKLATVTIRFNEPINVDNILGNVQVSDNGLSIIVRHIPTNIPIENQPDDTKPEELPDTKPEELPDINNPEENKPEELPDTKPEHEVMIIIDQIHEKLSYWALQLTNDGYMNIGNPGDTTYTQEITNLKNSINQVLRNQEVSEIKFFTDKSKKMGLAGKRVIKVGLVFANKLSTKQSFNYNNYTYDAKTQMLTTAYLPTKIDNILKDSNDNKYDLSFVAQDLEAFIISEIKAATGTATPKKELDTSFSKIKQVMNNLPVTYAYYDRLSEFGDLTHRFTMDFSIKDKFKNYESLFEYVNGKMILKNLDLSDIETNLKNWSAHNNYRVANEAGRMGSMWSMHYQLDPNDTSGNTMEWFLATNLHVAEAMFNKFDPKVYGSPSNSKMLYKHKYEITNENVYLTTPANGNENPLLEFKPNNTEQSNATFVAKKLTVYTDAPKPDQQYNGDTLDLFSSSGDYFYNLDFCIFEFEIDITDIKNEIKQYFRYVSSAYQNYLDYTKTHTLRPPNPFPLDPPKPVIQAPLTQRVLVSSYPQFNQGSKDLYYQYFSGAESRDFKTLLEPFDTEVLDSPFLDTDTVKITNGSSGSGVYLIDNLFENMYTKFPIAVFRSRVAPIDSIFPDENGYPAALQWRYRSHIIVGTQYDVYLNFKNLLTIKDTLTT